MTNSAAIAPTVPDIRKFRNWNNLRNTEKENERTNCQLNFFASKLNYRRVEYFILALECYKNLSPAQECYNNLSKSE